MSVWNEYDVLMYMRKLCCESIEKIHKN